MHRGRFTGLCLTLVCFCLAALTPAFAAKLAQRPGKRPAQTPVSEIRFTDVTEAAGLSFDWAPGEQWTGSEILDIMQRNMGNGAAVGDYDNDGDLDIYLLGQLGHANVLYRNDLDRGRAGFTDVTAEAGGEALACINGLSRTAQFVDLDDDGDLDLLVVNDEDDTHIGTRLLRNDGDGTFTDATDGSGITTPGWLRCGIAAADYDRDGLLDLYITNWGAEAGRGRPEFPGYNLLFRNLGGLRFEDVTEESGLGFLARDSFTAIFADFDENGYPDLHVAVDHTNDEFYANYGGKFLRVSRQVQADHRGNDMGVAAADFDNDGDLDMYSTNITDPDFLFGTDQGNVLYVSQWNETGVLRFTDEAFVRGAWDTYWGWGVEFTDLENDGDLDLLAANGFEEFLRTFPGADSLRDKPTVAMVHDGEGMFTRTILPGLDAPQDSRALIAFDYDRDGDEDVLITNVGGPARLYRNDRSSGHWFEASVVQRQGENAAGIGATLYATIGDTTRRRDVLAGESYLSGTPSEVHFGLGDAQSIDELVVEWTDGTTSTYVDVPVDRAVVIYQSPGDADRDGDLDRADLRRFRTCRRGGELVGNCHAFDVDLNGVLDQRDAEALAERIEGIEVRPYDGRTERPRIVR